MLHYLFFQTLKRENGCDNGSQPFIVHDNGKSDDGSVMAGDNISISISDINPDWVVHPDRTSKASTIH